MKTLPWIAALLISTPCVPTWAGNFTVGVEASDYRPIGKGDAGDYTSYGRDLLDSFASKYGHTFTYKPLPVARLDMEFLQHKSLDFKFPDNAHWVKGKRTRLNVIYSKGLVSITEGLMVLPANKDKTTVNNIVTLRGFTPQPYLDRINAKAMALQEVDTLESALLMVVAERSDGAYVSRMTATHLMANVMKRPGMLVYADRLPNTTVEFSLSTISQPEVIKQMDEFLIKERDSVVKLKAKYNIID